MADNLLVVHGGGPTAVINASLYGVIREAKKNPSIGKVLGAIGGTGAIFTEQFLDLTAFSDAETSASHTGFGHRIIQISAV